MFPVDFLGQKVSALLLPIQELVHTTECLGQVSHYHSQGCSILFEVKAPTFKMVLKASV